MRFVLLTAWKDLRRRLADWPALALWLGIPILIGVIMSLAFGRERPAPQVHVLVADEDASFFGRLLEGASSSEPAGGLLRIERVPSAEEGRRRMQAGEASALLILPPGLTDAVLHDRPATLVLVTNPAQRILPEIARTGAEVLVEGVFYVQALFGDAIRAFTESRPPGGRTFADADVAALAGAVNRTLRQLESVAFPPVLGLEMASDGSPARSTDFASLFLPTMLFMSLLFVSGGFGGDLWEERRFGTLRRAVALPHPPAAFLGGKLLAGALFVAVVSAAGLGVAVVATSVPVARLPGALLWCTFSGAVLVCLFSVLQFTASTERGANVVTTMVTFPLMMIGGTFFPFETMPVWMAAVGRLTPNGQGVVHLRALLSGSVDGRELAVAVVAMGLPALAAFLLSARLLRGRFAAGA